MTDRCTHAGCSCAAAYDNALRTGFCAQCGHARALHPASAADSESVAADSGLCRDCGCSAFAGPVEARHCAACGHARERHLTAPAAPTGPATPTAEGSAMDLEAGLPLGRMLAVAGVITVMAVAGLGAALSIIEIRDQRIVAIDAADRNLRATALRIADKRAYVASLDGSIQGARADIARAEADIVNAKGDAKGLPARIAELKAERNALEEQLEAAYYPGPNSD
jgi:hypothetical protein